MVIWMENIDKSSKDDIIKKVTAYLQKLGKEVQDNDGLTLYEKVTKADVLLDTIHFLSDYDENVKVLNSYWKNKRYKQKFDIDRDDI